MHVRTRTTIFGATLVAIVLALLTSSAPHAAGGGTVAAYAFDDAAGTTVRDASGKGNNGSTQNTTWSTSGRFGGALTFNGTSSWVSVPDSATLDLTDAFTLEAWVKPAASMGTAWRTIMIKERTNDLVYGLYANSDTSVPSAAAVTPGGRTDSRGTSALQPNVWTHVATTWDGGTMRLYVNGTQVSSRSVNGSMPVSTGALRIGGNGVRGEWFNGQLDDLRIYSQAQSASKISTDMATPVSTPPPADTTPPSTPTAFAATSATTTSITTSWSASTDNVAVAGYHVLLDGLNVATTSATGFTFPGLTCGTSYPLDVEAFDAAGNTSLRQSIIAATAACPDTTPPSTPFAFTTTSATTTSIATSWTASTDNVAVAGYHVFRDGLNVATTSVTSFTFAGLACGTSHTLAVEAFDAAGNLSVRTSISATASACPDLTPPSTPTAFAATGVTTTSITTSWTASTDNVAVAGYNVFRNGLLAATTSVAGFAFAGLPCGTSHTLAVEAFDAAGNISTRPSITATTSACPDTTPPSTPSSFIAGAASPTSIPTSWAPSSDNVAVAGYTLYGNGVSVGTVSGAVVATAAAGSFTFAGLTCGTSYLLGIEAFDAAGNTSLRQSITASTTPCPDLTPPSAPTAFATAGATTTSIATSWTAATDNIAVAGYHVFLDGVSAATTATTAFTFAGLACGTSHALAVEAFDTAGNLSVRASITAATSACPDLTPPSTPTAFAATAATTTSIATLWTASTDNVAVAGYNVFLDGANAATTSVTGFTFAGLTCGTSHTLAVEAFDGAGNLSSRASIIATTTACPDTTPPTAPTVFHQTGATATSLTTSWSGATDNVAVVGYHLFRDGINVGTTSVGFFTFSALLCGTTHTLAIEAFDAAGNLSVRPSITASTNPCADATPPSTPTAFTATGATTTSIATSWTASTDNIAVAGYRVFLDGVSAATTATTGFTFPGLSCGTSHTLAVEAFDAAGNLSARPSITATTAACPDTTPPSTPTAFTASGTTTTSITTSWTASIDNVGVTGYNVFLDGVRAATTSVTGFTLAPLTCGTSHTLAVEAFDAAGNLSVRPSITATTAACPDTTPPTTPTALTATTATTTSIATSWAASTDNVAIAGYHVFLDGLGVGTTAVTSFTFAALACGTSHTLAVEAFDAAGNTSARPSITAFTASCPDTAPPSAPAAFQTTVVAATSIATSWTASTDNVAVAGYHLFLDGVNVATTTATNFTFAGLTCGTSHTLAVEAFDAAGNLSIRPSLTATTTPCPDTTPPQVALTAPAAGATVSASVQVTASASDAGGVASVQFTLDGANLGAAVTGAPYTLAWDSLGAANGAHTLGARATDTSGNASTAPAVAITVQNTLNTANAFKRVDIGPGFVDASLRGVIRTSGNRVYAFVADDTAQRKATGPGVIHAYRADQIGIPTSFTEVDALRRPSATGVTHVVGAPDVRLASNGVAHMVYTDETNATLWYETFSTATDTWGPRLSLATGVDIPAVAIKREASNALVLDASDVPHVVYAGGGVVQYRNRAGGAWSAPTTVSSGGTPIHVGLAAAFDGTLDVTWLQNGVAPSVSFAQRSSLGAWSAAETVAGSDVLSNSNADQGPSIAVDSANRPSVLYVSASKGTFGPAGHTAAYGAVRIKTRIAGVWTFDNPTPDALTHTPQIYLQGNNIYAFNGHDTGLDFAYSRRIAGGLWSAEQKLSTLPVDGSANIRWDPLHETNAGVIDATFFDEDILNNKTYFPEAYYMAVLPGGTASTDTTAPTATLTAPAAGATVSGTAVAVSANAADNIAVAGVQFKLDGANLGAEDTTAPYSINWDSTTVANGSHTLTAVARDAAGNTATAASVTVTTSNVGAPPPAGTVLVGNATTEANIDSNAAGMAEAFKTTAALSGSVKQLRVFIDAGSTAGNVVVGLYSNNATGHPGTLLTTGTITAPAVGQNNAVAVTAAAVTAGQTYWIAVLAPSGALKFRDRTGVGAGSSETSSQPTLTSLPATWTTGSSFTDGLLSAVGLG